MKTGLSRYNPRLVLVPGVAPLSLQVSADGKYSLKVLFCDTTLRGTLKEEKLPCGKTEEPVLRVELDGTN